MQIFYQTISKCIYQRPDVLSIPLNVLLPLVHGLQISLERVQPFPEHFVFFDILLDVVREVRLEKREDNVFLAVVVIVNVRNPGEGIACERDDIRRRCRNRRGMLVY